MPEEYKILTVMLIFMITQVIMIVGDYWIMKDVQRRNVKGTLIMLVLLVAIWGCAFYWVFNYTGK